MDRSYGPLRICENVVPPKLPVVCGGGVTPWPPVGVGCTVAPTRGSPVLLSVTCTARSPYTPAVNVQSVGSCHWLMSDVLIWFAVTTQGKLSVLFVMVCPVWAIGVQSRVASVLDTTHV